ncbi:serine protease snake [Diabrotica virgifera virgifera]|uniref:Serine protease snake-like n=1 Tax=Diabrotica virgifera virgifera TaxID=50390 RepID=A0A6P7FZC2_DIAVI|nr:serine protease snake [Diabrotica virgifera virgifera]
MRTVNLLICIICVYLNIANGNSQDSSPGAKANEMCKIYTENAKKNNNCPIPLFTPLISRGQLAEIGEFPHMVQVGYKGDNGTEWLVSGFIISKNYVLTVAHGARPRGNSPPEIVRAGVTDQADLSKAQIRTIESIIVHPEYKPPVKYNDIALLKIKEDFVFNKFVNPICLHTSEENPDVKGIHSGWGATSYLEDRPTHMVKIIVNFDSNESCNKSFSGQHKTRALPQGIIKDKLVCAGGNQTDGCQGESGGPLQIFRRDEYGTNCIYDAVGISSFGVPCGVTEKSSVFTRVSHYIPWIEEIVWAQK